MIIASTAAAQPMMPPADPDKPATKGELFELEQRLRKEMKAGFAAVRQDMKSQAAATDKKIADSEARVMQEVGKVKKSLEDFRTEQLAVNANTTAKFDAFGKKLDATNDLAVATKAVADKVAADFAADIKNRPQVVKVVQGPPINVNITVNYQPPPDVRPIRYEVYPVTQQVIAYYPGDIACQAPSYAYNWWWYNYAYAYNSYWNTYWGGIPTYNYALGYRPFIVRPVVVRPFVVRGW